MARVGHRSNVLIYVQNPRLSKAEVVMV
jgi:hypothetical protein